MQASDVAEALAALQPDDYGWRCELPPSARVFGCPVALELETRPCPAEGLPPAPSPGEVDLARRILSGIAEVLAIAERQCAIDNADFPDVMARLDRPRVWICREFQERDGPDRWAFLIGISDAPDWSIFVEFRGLDFLEIWSGD